jgi:hypothetical protein
MESNFPAFELIHEGRKVRSAMKMSAAAGARQDLRPFSWLMVTVISVLDICVSQQRIPDLIINVFVKILDNSDAEDSLRVNIEVNVQSWRSVGQVRRVVPRVSGAFKKTWLDKSGGSEAVPDLNRADTEEMASFLTWILSGDERHFNCISAATFAAAKAIETAGIFIKATSSPQILQGLLQVTYEADGSHSPLRIKHLQEKRRNSSELQRSLASRAQRISYPIDEPKCMIDAIDTTRGTQNRMREFWEYGQRAAKSFRLCAKADLPYSPDSELYYELDSRDDEVSSFGASVSIMVGKGFPCASQAASSAMEKLLEGQTNTQTQWLETHAGLEFLEKSQSSTSSGDVENMHVWLPYQALVFGFYYKLLGALVVTTFLSDGGVYFQGVWGCGSTTFLAMCTSLGQELRRNRSHQDSDPVHAFDYVRRAPEDILQS